MVQVETVVRTGGVFAGVAGLGAAGAALAREAATAAARLWVRRDHLAFDDLVLAGALGVLALTAVWLTLGILLTAVTEGFRCTHGSLGRLAALITPRLCRTVLRGACGAAVLATPGTVVPAVATTAAEPQAVTHGCTTRACATDLTTLPVPDRPSTATASSAAGAPSDPAPVVVRPGDTLWSIAAGHLPAGAGDDAVAAAWPVWFDANRSRLGPDPDLIHPRTRLVVPARFRPDDKDS